MPDDTDILGLPLILPSQAQKHVTHNEALAVLDVVVQLAVLNRDQTAPPALPGLGDRHLVAAGAALDWAGKDGQIAVMTEVGWQFWLPRPGWQAHVLAEGQTAAFDGLVWKTLSDGALSVAQLGVSATADVTNRLSVSSPATLLNHAGAGHQLKLNKAAPGDTASLLFQTGFSGRAEMGTVGSDNFAVKVSADGTTFNTVLQAVAASGVAELPSGARLPDGSAVAPALAFSADTGTGLHRTAAGEIGLDVGGATRAFLSAAELQVNVAVTGTAVSQNQADTTTGRLVRVGDYGLGGAGLTITDWNDATVNGATFMAASAANAPVAGAWFIGTYQRNGATYGVQEVNGFTGTAAGRTWTRRQGAGSWNPWRETYNQGSILGPVSQALGVPTGAVIERGTNANGEYVRLADGTQICTRTNLSAANASTALGSLFRSANVTWTYPAAFIAAPVVSGDVDDADGWTTTVGAPGLTSSALRVVSAVTKAAALNFRALAVGRWF
ncbi:MAG: DUF2793 domain-containing protein [Paracoccaceae bacterium]